MELSADALYWKSTRDPIQVWSQQAGTPTNFFRTYELNPGYNWGARVHGQWNLPCDNWFVRGGYLYLQTLDHSRIRGLNVTAPWGGLSTDSAVNAADASLTLYYQRAELLAGYNFHKGRCARAYTYGGGFWVDLLQKFKSDVHGTLQAESVNARLIQKTRAQGVGAIIGFGGEYNVTQGLYLLGRFGGMALAAERDLKSTTRGPAAVQENGRLEALYPSNWGLFPGFEASVAVRYTAGFCGLWISGELGWEIQHYFNAFRTVVGSPAGAQTTFIDCGFAGPYAGLRLKF
jgi:Legionella pneumophila major outer membrane protein precursor